MASSGLAADWPGWRRGGTSWSHHCCSWWCGEGAAAWVWCLENSGQGSLLPSPVPQFLAFSGLTISFEPDSTIFCSVPQNLKWGRTFILAFLSNAAAGQRTTFLSETGFHIFQTGLNSPGSQVCPWTSDHLKHWNYRHACFYVAGEPRASCVLGKYSTNQAISSVLLSYGKRVRTFCELVHVLTCIIKLMASKYESIKTASDGA